MTDATKEAPTRTLAKLEDFHGKFAKVGLLEAGRKKLGMVIPIAGAGCVYFVALGESEGNFNSLPAAIEHFNALDD